MSDTPDSPLPALSRHQETILRLVRLHGGCSVQALARELAVSTETVRRHLKPLGERGLLLRVHGGVLPAGDREEPPFQRRMAANAAAKQRIARQLAARIRPGDSLLLDTGSTTLYVARALLAHRDLLVVTNSTEIARTLAPRNGNRVLMAGGELRADDVAVFGVAAQNFVRQFQVRYAVLSMGAIHAGQGFMDFHLCEAEFSRAAMGQAEQVVVVADSSKFNRRGFVKVCDPEQVGLLITEAPPPADLQSRLEAAGVMVQVAGD